VEDRALHPRLKALFDTCLADNRQAWELCPDGSYVQRNPGDEPDRGTHRLLLRDPLGLEAIERQPQRPPDSVQSAPDLPAERTA
jgi:hypothetical protein